MQKKINIAVVGCGYWGPNLIRNFSALPECHVRYVCDKDEKRLAHMKQLYPAVEPTKEFEKIVGDKDVDAVVVATPVHLHYELAKKSPAGREARLHREADGRPSEQCRNWCSWRRRRS